MADTHLIPLGHKTWLNPAEPFVRKLASPREVGLYRRFLADPATGAPALLAALPGPGGRLWLHLERLPQHHPDFSAAEAVTAAFRHLAHMHTRFASGGRTLLHGDYHRWNLLLHQERVRVVDWERGRLGHPIWDLVLLAPEEPGWDGVPRGALAEVALRTYHGHGPLATLSWREFLRLQAQARLAIATRWAKRHRARAARAPSPGAAAPILQLVRAEEDRAARLQALKEGAG